MNPWMKAQVLTELLSLPWKVRDIQASKEAAAGVTEAQREAPRAARRAASEFYTQHGDVAEQFRTKLLGEGGGPSRYAQEMGGIGYTAPMEAWYGSGPGVIQGDLNTKMQNIQDWYNSYIQEGGGEGRARRLAEQTFETEKRELTKEYGARKEELRETYDVEGQTERIDEMEEDLRTRQTSFMTATRTQGIRDEKIQALNALEPLKWTNPMAYASQARSVIARAGQASRDEAQAVKNEAQTVWLEKSGALYDTLTNLKTSFGREMGDLFETYEQEKGKLTTASADLIWRGIQDDQNVKALAMVDLPNAAISEATALTVQTESQYASLMNLAVTSAEQFEAMGIDMTFAFNPSVALISPFFTNTLNEIMGMHQASIRQNEMEIAQKAAGFGFSDILGPVGAMAGSVWGPIGSMLGGSLASAMGQTESIGGGAGTAIGGISGVGIQV